MELDPHAVAVALQQCRAALPGWASLTDDQLRVDAPKGFSSFTLSVRAPVGSTPPAVLYRRLEDKDNAILDGPLERKVFVGLGDADIAPRCYHYSDDYRLESFYEGRTLAAADLSDPATLQGIAAELHRFHQLTPAGLPQTNFFDLLHDKWGPLALNTVVTHRDRFPENERTLCDALVELTSDATRAMVRRCIPSGPQVFCHNDTYHGNIMKLDSGAIRLLDFEFSCTNHPAFDFSNLFAETVMRHKLPEYPYFDIAEPEFTDLHIGTLVSAYLNHDTFASPAARTAAHDQLVTDTRNMLLLSDYMYAMAALPLALAPIQKIPFVPYAYRRFQKFKRTWAARFSG